MAQALGYPGFGALIAEEQLTLRQIEQAFNHTARIPRGKAVHAAGFALATIALAAYLAAGDEEGLAIARRCHLTPMRDPMRRAKALTMKHLDEIMELGGIAVAA